MWKLKPPLEMPLGLKYKHILEQLMPTDPSISLNLKKLSAEEEFPNLAKNQTCMAKVLTIQMYKRLRARATQSGFTLDDIIQPGVDKSERSSIRTVGCVAGDAESYTVFMEFFDPLIELYHHDYQPNRMHRSNLNPENLKGGANLDELYVLTCQVSTGRNVDDFCFPPHCSRGERRALEKLAIGALNALDGEFKGTYHSLKNLSEEELQRLTAAGILSDNLISPLMLSSGMARDWPDSRGVWHNDMKNFIVWVNKEDHLRITSIQDGGNVKQVFTRYCFGLKKLEEIYHQKKHPFIWKDNLGYVSTCPSDLGTGMRASVHIRLKYISKHQKFDEILQRLRLEKKLTGAADASVGTEVWDISNADRIGFSEVELVQLLVDGIKLLIHMDKYIEQGRPIEDLFPTQKQMDIHE
ncbi:creatine kinase M-type-like isoform X1 [Rhincodon typus]|uniref:creatine kinase M-type-like isoform X1 n=2 Tax=Rhincodon typus TaxID=259920 RepID=UPI0020302C56|nr:creatine kinase M-type-like isoform X1 [Rhincodon typus]